ncbi:BTB/POZ domain-containing protein [Plectosphaerella plurivora]|uniref:BTB/POZ domain-containing protein n=1 Tax=Plectosphaerella plurivora TaxID=936078 RepID=A0A9P9A6G7_9PEZI|nr:BTB/POZ domain-containing protein [Plectosphaerella plurivora]
MSHLLWKYYLDNDVDRFRRLLAPAGHGHGTQGSGSWASGTSPRVAKSRKASTFGALAALGKAEVNSRDHAGLTLLLRAASSASSSAFAFVEALLAHPAIDLHAQDPESGWNALHRALYAGNISIARFLTEQAHSSVVAKDHEGYSPFDLYNSTIALRDLKQSLDLDNPDDASESGASDNDDYGLSRSVAVLDTNLSLGVGDEDDPHLLQRFYEEYLEEAQDDPAFAAAAALADPSDPDQIPALTKHRPLRIHDAILNDPVSNIGRLGLGDENTQFRLADKKVNHTMALTSQGELGYALPPARQDEEPMSVHPRQEKILGIAASAVHSVAHTATSLYCWGRNIGQLALMDADSRSLECQSTPRKVAASLFSSNIVSVSAIDKATTCLLEDSSVCVFTSYGYNFVKFPVPDVFANQQFTPRNAIRSISSGGETIAVVSARGDLFTVSLNHKAESAPSATSTTNPTKIKGALTDGVRSVSVGEHGSVIICTESGAVWRRIKRAKAKDAGPGSAGAKRGDFKFQRVPGVNDIVTVRSSTYGAFAAIRKDCDVMKQQISVARQSLASDLAPLLALRGFEATAPSSNSDMSKFWEAESLRERIGELPYQLLRSSDLDTDLQDHLRYKANHVSDVDILVRTTSSPDILIPVHGWLLAARSPTLRGVFAEYRSEGEYLMPETLELEECDGKTLITFHSLDLLSLVNVIIYCYDDAVVPAWNFTRQAPPLAFRYRQIRTELMKLATKLQMSKLEAAVRLQTGVEKSLAEDMRLAIEDASFFEDADAILELDNDEEIAVHSQLLRQRCAFFEGLFHGRSGGMWLAGRQDFLEEDEQIRIDLEHVDANAFRYVMRFLYADVGTELFNDVVATDLDDFSDLVVQVMSIANELMLDRLSQICQSVLGKFATSRNIGLLLNEISPCSVTEFKDAGLEYVCLQMETMLENHFLDELDEGLLEELDEVVRQNQLSRYPFARSGRAELLLHDSYPELAGDIEEERQIRVKEMAYKVLQKDDDRKVSTSLRARFGSFDDISGTSPAAEPSRRRSKAGQNEPFSPTLRHSDSRADLMFDMDEDRPLALASPIISARTRPVQLLTQAVPLATSLKKPDSHLERGVSPGTHSTPPAAATPGSVQTTPFPASTESKNKGKAPWGDSPLPTSKLDLREMLTGTPPKSALSASLAAQKAADASPRAAQLKMSQKERKKQQMAQAAALLSQEAEDKLPKAAWDTQGSAKRPAPWKAVSSGSGSKASLQDLMAAEKPMSASSANPKPLVAAESSPRSTPRRTASPDTRFSGQSRSGSAKPAPSPSSSSRQAPPTQPLVPHSKSYKTSRPKYEPMLGLSMQDIIGQQKREQEIVKEAAAKRSMQEIQQEQEFQEWWDQESRRIQEEEARRAAKDDKDAQPKTSKRGRRGRTGGKGDAEGSAGQTEPAKADKKAAKASASTATSSGNNRGKSSRGRGGKGPTGKKVSA